MSPETDCLTIIMSLLTGTMLVWITGKSLYYKIRKKYPITVNCWFCDTNTKVADESRNSWECPSCDQYNGFSADGGYNKAIPAQYDESLNNLVTGRQNKLSFRSNNGLCRNCNRNQELKMYQLASFSPRNPAKYDREVESFRKRLEKEYKLCDLCEDVLARTLNNQKDWLFFHDLANSRKRVLSQDKNLVLMTKYSYQWISRFGLLIACGFFVPVEFLRKRGLSLKKNIVPKIKYICQWIRPHAPGLARIFLVLLSVWIILVHCVKLCNGASPSVSYIVSMLPNSLYWVMDLTLEWLWALTGAAMFIQVIAALDSRQKNSNRQCYNFSFVVDSICCMLWLGQQTITCLSPSDTHKWDINLKNSTWGTTLGLEGCLETLSFLTLFCEAIAAAIYHLSDPKKNRSSTHLENKKNPMGTTLGDSSDREGTGVQKNLLSANKNLRKPPPPSVHFAEDLRSKASSLACDDEDELGIGNLSLGPIEVTEDQKAGQGLLRRTKPVIHPARLNIKNIVQSSWVAGGYWQVPNSNWYQFSVPYQSYHQMPFQNAFACNGPPLSRSSSQSSGFVTSGSASSSICGDYESVFMVSESAYRKHPYYGNIFSGNHHPSSFSYLPGHPGLVSTP